MNKNIVFNFTEIEALAALEGCQVVDKRIIIDPKVKRGLKACSAISYLCSFKGYEAIIGKAV